MPVGENQTTLSDAAPTLIASSGVTMSTASGFSTFSSIAALFRDSAIRSKSWLPIWRSSCRTDQPDRKASASENTRAAAFLTDSGRTYADHGKGNRATVDWRSTDFADGVCKISVAGQAIEKARIWVSCANRNHVRNAAPNRPPNAGSVPLRSLPVSRHAVQIQRYADLFPNTWRS